MRSKVRSPNGLAQTSVRPGREGKPTKPWQVSDFACDDATIVRGRFPRARLIVAGRGVLTSQTTPCIFHLHRGARDPMSFPAASRVVIPKVVSLATNLFPALRLCSLIALANLFSSIAHRSGPP